MTPDQVVKTSSKRFSPMSKNTGSKEPRLSGVIAPAGGSTHAAIRIPLTGFAQLTGATWLDVCKEM